MPSQVPDGEWANYDTSAHSDIKALKKRVKALESTIMEGALQEALSRRTYSPSVEQKRTERLRVFDRFYRDLLDTHALSTPERNMKVETLLVELELDLRRYIDE